jgi:hypothetical protein
MITPNISGVLVMCTRGKESRAAKEAIDLFTEVRDKKKKKRQGSPLLTVYKVCIHCVSRARH